MRLKILTDISDVKFEDCYRKRIVGRLDGVEVNLIDLENLKKSKSTSGRTIDMVDLENLP